VDNEPKDLRPEKGDGALVLITPPFNYVRCREPGSLILANPRRSPTPMYGVKRVPSANPAVNTTIVQPIVTHQGLK
jgi:hypothetical protein